MKESLINSWDYKSLPFPHTLLVQKINSFLSASKMAAAEIFWLHFLLQ